MVAIFAFAVISSAEAQNVRQRKLIDIDWRFQLGDPADITNVENTNVTYYPEISNLPKLEAGAVSGNSSETFMESLRVNPVAAHVGENVSVVQTNFNDSGWRLLNLPHDWVVELPFNSSADYSHGFKPVGNSSFGINNTGWYRHTFALPANYAGQTLSLEFDGVYRNCLVWLNGHILGRNVSGYSGFAFDISKYTNIGGTNVLVVRVDASRFEGWFYEGAGIYRHVWLVKTAPVHVAHWGTYVTSAVNGTNATVAVQTQVNNDNTNSVAACILVSTIVDSSGNTVATATQALSVPKGGNHVVTQTLSITNVHLWSLQSPNLYQMVSTITRSGVTNDVYQTPFGVRTIKFDANQGLFLNDQRVAIQGMCNHQDHAGVGSALPDRLQYYRIERLKEMGCNVYRTSHNPPTPELLDACDRLGMLVLDENRRFGTNAEPMGELQSLILRDRNHPSVFCWSMCNEEIYLERDSGTGASLLQGMVNLAHQLDPSRKCTAAMDKYSAGAADGFSLAVDVQGFNYRNHANLDGSYNMEGFHSANPNMPTFGTEETSSFYTRGIYANTSTYDSAYDVNRLNYSSSAEGWWQYYSQRPWTGGACVWTGFDYRGEATPFGWPNISSEFGALDTCGFAKDVYYYYQANWTDKNVLHIFPHWNWAGKEGQPINIWCYSGCESVELFLNGISQGMKAVNVQSHVEWNVSYAAGTLQAIGYRNGRAVMTNSIATTGAPAGIVLKPDRDIILADGMDVSMVSVAVVDAQGRFVPTAANTINFTISGGAIIGVGNGDPASHEADKASARSVFSGLAQVIVQSSNQAGPIVLTATASGLTPASVTIDAASSLPVPPSPTNALATAGNGQMWLNWDVVPGAISYNVKRSTTKGGTYATVASLTPNSYFTDTGLSNGTPYFYVVSALNTNGESANSVEVSVTPLSLPAPTAPANLAATPYSSAQISLNWNASAAATSYYVKRSTVSGGPYTAIENTTGTTFNDSGLTSTTTYYYVVSATNSVGASVDSAQAGAKPGMPSPIGWFKADAITGLANGASVANWNDSSGHSNNASNSTLAQQPTYVTGAMNGLPVVRFNAANSKYLAFNRVVQDDFTISCVFQSSQGLDTGNQYWQGAGLVSGEVQGPQNDFGTALNVNGQVVAGVGNPSISPDTTVVSGTNYNDGRAHLMTFTRSQRNGTFALYVDGNLAYTATGSTNSLTTPSQLVLGAQQTLNNFLTGDIAEVEIFNSALINMDRQTMEAALISKYAIKSANSVSLNPQPGSREFSRVYAGMPATYSVTPGATPITTYQWYQISSGFTNAIVSATGPSLTYLAQTTDTGIAIQFFVVASNSYGSVTSSFASLTATTVVAGSSGPISAQFAVTNYIGYTGFFLAAADKAGVYAASNWNVLAITPDPSGVNSTVTANNLVDSSNVSTPVSLVVANVNDGWHQNASVSGISSANARMMNTFWKANPTKLPATSTLNMTLTNLQDGTYDAYVYLMQNEPGDGGGAGYLYGNGVTNYFTEFVNFGSASNFVTTVDATGNVKPTVNYLKLAGIPTGGTRSIALTTVWTGGGISGLGVSGIQLVPTVPPAPTGLSAVSGNAQASLSWTASSGATSYNLKRSTTNGGLCTIVANTATTNYIDTGLTNGATYYYAVSAVNVSAESADSAQVSAKPLAPVPITMGFLIQTGSIRLIWSGGSGRYQVQMSTNLFSGNWINVDGLISTNLLLITPSNTVAFYRILAEPS